MATRKKATKKVVRTRGPQEHRDPDQALDNEEALRQHQRRAVAAAWCMPAQIESGAPDNDERRDDQPGPEQPAMNVDQGAQDVIIGPWTCSECDVKGSV